MNNAEEKNTSHMIFYGEKDIAYTKSSNYAFLNWNFDNSLGGKDNVSQLIQDNFVMGNAYMGNAVLSLYSILCSGNYCSTADVLIFPIMFDLWHGVELWLKSSVDAIYYILGMDNEVKKNHKIYEYLEVLEKELKKLGMEQTIDIALPELIKLIKELQRVNANFDFTRYSFRGKRKYQFYNAPLGEDEQWQKKEKSEDERMHVDWISEMPIVPNTCVDLQELFVIILGLVDNFRTFVEYLTLVIADGGQLTDDAYKKYLTECEKVQKNMEEWDNNEGDMDMKAMMKFVYSHIL